MIRQRIVIRSIALLVALLPALAHAAAEDWRLDRDKDGIQVYTRAVEGSELREFRAEMIVEASVEQGLRLLDDTDNLVNWLADCEQAERMEQIDEFTAVNYVQYAQPWPVSDRDMYVRSQAHINQEDGSAEVTLRGVPDYKPEKRGMVRIPYLKGSWNFTPAENGKTRVVYQVLAKPGGAVPAFLANRAATDAPLETLQNMREQLPK
jgi:hypothetical protein